ncbi:hypothetical protein GWI72_09920 [Microvirga tunisiensis]|uniref:Uncharacterized protein n=1 Tax=Pannonibacter tanglangensis TaxID=2750084 RepID=A0A7X5J8D4_9HYPH|nr:hypothetical protein [Pannonibacter sp. XCT-53]NBN78584.1 hypothetical protein [Pannonibacter sp. XCT-53]
MKLFNIAKVASVAIALSAVSPVVVSAQGVNVASVVAACGAGSPCAPLVRSLLANVPAAQRTAVIAELAASLAEIQGGGANIAEALRAAAELSTDPAQQAALTDLADAIGGGDGALDGPVAAGPAADDGLDAPDGGSDN